MSKLREILKQEYGITSDEELMQAVRSQRTADIGIFVSACGLEDKNVEAVG